MIRVVQRALSVLECFSPDKPSMSLHEISNRIGLPKSTTFRLLSTLTDAGYLVQKSSQEYALSYKLMWLGGIVQKSLNINELARPLLERLAAATGETIDLSILNGDHRICLDVAESAAPLKSIVHSGERLALIHGATGKIFLAHMDQTEAKEILKSAKKELSMSVTAYLKLLETIRENGYSRTDSERVEGASALAVPIYDQDTSVRYCLTLTGPTFRFEGREDEFTKVMISAAEQLSTQLGGYVIPEAVNG